MLEIALAKINSFAHVAQQAKVPPSEPIFVLSSSQLQEIITRAVQEATGPLVERIEALESWREDQAEVVGSLTRAIKKEPEGDSPLLDELYKEMKAIGRKQADFATAARMVKRSKARLFQLKASIALDERFILIPSESHSQKILIRLRELYKTV